MPHETRLRTAANRRTIARMFTHLNEGQLNTPSLCAGWTCRDVLGHLVMTIDLSVPKLLLEVARDRGRADITSTRLARTYSARPLPELIDQLDTQRDVVVAGPGMGADSALADSCIHLRDVAIPLGISTTPPPKHWAAVLEFLTTRRARAARYLPGSRLRGLHLQATDSGWRHGRGPVVIGTSEALAMSLTGRQTSLDQLIGDGSAVLQQRLRAHRGHSPAVT